VNVTYNDNIDVIGGKIARSFETSVLVCSQGNTLVLLLLLCMVRQTRGQKIADVKRLHTKLLVTDDYHSGLRPINNTSDSIGI